MPTAEAPTVQTPKPKRKYNAAYTPEQRAEAIRKLAKGQTQISIGADLGIPQTTIGEWAIAAGLGRTNKQSLVNRVQAKLKEQVERISNHATGQVEELLAKSLAFGNSVLEQAQSFVPCVGPDGLLQVANAGKVGVAVSRQALGLCDTTEKVIVRVDLMGSIQPANQVIDVTPSPASIEPPKSTSTV
jgi:transposase-like protein